MAIYGDGKHDSGNEVNFEDVGGKKVPADRTREISLDKVKVKFLIGTTSSGNKIVELVEGFEREDPMYVGPEGRDYDEGDITHYNAALDALESLILAHASEGIDVTSEAYQNGVQTALDACANNL